MLKEKLLKKALSAYAGEHVLQRVLARGEDALKLGGQVADLTMYFQDITGFTTVAEPLEPENLVRLLHEYLTVMTETVEKNKGVVVQYMGDAVMALFGIDGEPDHADRACSCALVAVHQADALSQRWNFGAKPLRLTIGINTGKVLLGNFGTYKRFQFTVLGDAVNLASRLEGGNKNFGTNILLSEFTRRELVKHSNVREVDTVQVKGKYAPVKLYTLEPETPNNSLNRTPFHSAG